MSGAPAIGIDLGTTNSCAAIHDGTRAQVIRSSLGYTTIPSVLAYNRYGEEVIGQHAERQMALKPHECIYGSKRLLGRAFGAGVRDRFQPHFAYELISDQAGLVAARLGERTISLIDVSASILREIKDAADAALGQTVTRAVITVPAYFHENQRAFVRQAGQLAGLEVLRVISEPTAAAVAFGTDAHSRKRVLVFDLGGGTFDVSVVAIDRGSFGVIGVDGDTFLGGLDFDRRLADLTKRKLAQRVGREVSLDAIGQARLMVAAKVTKHELSQQAESRVQVRCLELDDKTSLDLDEVITADEYVAACSDLLSQIGAVVRRALDRARIRPRDIDEVLLVGGQTRMPAVQQLIRDTFGKEPTKRVHADEAVAIGAAIVAYTHDRREAASLSDMLPMPIGTAAADGQFTPIIPRNTVLPAELTFKVRARPSGALTLPLFQGDESHVFDNELLGAVVIDKVSARKKPVECSVTLRLDAEGVLTVSARPPGKGKEQDVRLATNVQPQELIAEVGRVEMEVILPPRKAEESAPSAARRTGGAAAGSPTSSARSGVPASRAGGSARAQGGGSAKRAKPEAPKPGLWQRILGWFGRGD